MSLFRKFVRHMAKSKHFPALPMAVNECCVTLCSCRFFFAFHVFHLARRVKFYISFSLCFFLSFFQDKIWVPVEPVRLHYSTPDRFPHYYSEVRGQKTGTHTNAEQNKMTYDYTSKGFSNIFYTTAQYLRAAFGARNKVYPANETTRRFYSEDSDAYSENWRTMNASMVEHGVERPPNYQDIKDERLNMADAVCMKGVDKADLTFKDGEMIAVVGKNGAGKSTLLYLLCGEFACGCGQVKERSSMSSEQRNVVYSNRL